MTKRKPYIRPMKATWWTTNPFFVRYIIREGTSVLVMAFSLELFYGLYAISQGEHAWANLLNWLTSPLSIALHILGLIAALIHTITWFSLAPKTMDLWIKNKKVDGGLITKGHHVAFVVTTLILIVIIGGLL